MGMYRAGREIGSTYMYSDGITGEKYEAILLEIRPHPKNKMLDMALIRRVDNGEEIEKLQIGLKPLTEAIKHEKELVEQRAKSRAENAALNKHLVRKDRYTCLDCGCKHNHGRCPECDGDSIETEEA